ncbi:CBS domain-containing protein [Catenuloplanes japonicus]|uniref:CBS domain-containing protein n=1 Tax=Catenuloplanes japonicus TaxID=33876 RepID=UPI000527DD81|nr:CBS domain-containing protein [Catenuloplanes japonicus]
MKDLRVGDVMTADVVTVTAGTPYRKIVDVLMRRRVSAVPVVDDMGRVLGVVSETDLLHKIEFADQEQAPRLFESRRNRRARAKADAVTAADLMSAPASVALRSTSITEAARRMDAGRIKRLPVVDALGRVVGIATRSDLLKVHLRSDGDIRADVEQLLGVDAVTVTVSDGTVTLAGELDRRTSVEIAVRLARQVPGVVEVTDSLTYAFDDTAVLYPVF